MYRHQSIVSLVARLDEFIADLLVIAFKAKPELLKGSDKSISLDDTRKTGNRLWIISVETSENMLTSPRNV